MEYYYEVEREQDADDVIELVKEEMEAQWE